MTTPSAQLPPQLNSEYPPITSIVPPIPAILGDSTEESEPGVDFLKHVRPEYKTPDDLANDYTTNGRLPGWDKPKPFAGQGKPLREAVKDAWATWREMLYSDAESGNTEAQIDLAMALWKGDANYQIAQDKREALVWMNRAATQSRHDINPGGNCGMENCFKCVATTLSRKMAIWTADEERQKDMSMAQIVGLYTPHLLFQILSYCDIQTLATLSTLNSLWHEIVSDPRAWAHIDMLAHFPIPTVPDHLLPHDSPLLLLQSKSQPSEQNPDSHPTQSSRPEPLAQAPRDSKKDFLLFHQLPAPHRNICRVCNEAIIAPPQSKDSLYLNPDHTYSQGYMIEAMTIPDPFWKFFACHRECFFNRAQGTITPYTLQGVKTLVFQAELKYEAQQQIVWEKHVFRRIEVANINHLSLASLPPPIKPAEYDGHKAWCTEFHSKHPDLLRFAEDHLTFEEDDNEDEDFEFSGSDGEFEGDDDPEVYGKQEDEAGDNEDGSDIDLDGFLGGDKFSLLGDDDINQNDYWLREVQKNKNQIRQYWSKLGVVEWYEHALKQYNQLSNIFLAYSSGLMYSPYADLYYKQFNNSQLDPKALLSELQNAPPVDISQQLSYYYFSYPQAFPPRKRAMEMNPYGDDDTAPTINPSDLPIITPPIISQYQSSSPESTSNDHNNIRTKLAQNPYEVPSIYGYLTRGKYPQHNFVIDNSPLWYILTNFTQYRKYAKLFHEYDDVVVEYPTRQQYLFAHGDSRYGDPMRSPYQTPTLHDYVHPTKQALPLVYELFQLLLRSTTGFRFLRYRALVLTELLPRFNLKYDPVTKTILSFPEGEEYIAQLTKKRAVG